MKIVKRPLCTIAFCVAALLFVGASGFAGTINWDGDNPIGNFTFSENWYGNTNPTSFGGWVSTNDLHFGPNNGSETSVFWDYGADHDIGDIYFDSSWNHNAVTWNGDGSTLSFKSKIENDSSFTVTLGSMKFSAGKFGAGHIELNPVNGDLILNITNGFFNDNSLAYQVYGNNGHTLTVNGVLGVGNTTTNVSFTNESNNIVIFGGNQTYGGGTFINGGSVTLGTGGAAGSAGAGAISIGGGFTLGFNRSDTPSFSNAITLAGASGSHDFLNVTGGTTATLSGAITSTSGAEFWKSGNGTLIITPNAGSNARTSSNVITAGTLQISDFSTSTLGSSNFFIQSGALSYTGSSVSATRIGNFALQASNSEIDVTAAATTLTLSQDLGGFSGGGLTKAGSGNLTLTASNTYNGGTNINAGTLQFAKTAAMPSSGNVTVAGGATLAVNAGGTNEWTSTTSGGGTLGGLIAGTGGQGTTNQVSWTAGSFLGVDTTNASGGLTYSGVIGSFRTGNNSVGLTKLGSNTLTLAGTSPNTYTGLTTVSAGELDLNKTAGVAAIAGDASTSTNDVAVSGGTLKWLASNQVGDTVTITVSGTGIVDLNGKTETIGSLINTGGTFTTNNSGTGGHLIGTTATIDWEAGTNTITSGGIVEDGHIIINGGTNTVQGGATEGLLHLLSGGLGLQMTGGTLTLNSDATNPGRLELEGNVTTSASSTTSFISSGGSATNPGVIDLNSGTRTFTVAQGTVPSGGPDLSISAKITNGSLIKAGTGMMTLTVANTYAGTTTINTNGGTLNAGAAGALGSTSSVTVNSGGTLLLSGSGNLNRVNDSAGISLGTTSGAGGTLARTGTASEGTGAHTTSGGLPVGTTGTNAVGLGALTLNSNSTLNFGTGGVGTLVFASFTPNAHVLNILNYTSSASGNNPLVSGTDGTDDRLIFNQDQGPLGNNDLADFSFGGISATEIALGGGFFEIVPVPEPSTWAAGALALSGLLLGQRRRLARLLKRA